MKLEEKKEKKKRLFIVISCILTIIVIFIILQLTRTKEVFLVCTISDKTYKNYQEVITYHYKGEVLESFKREEVISSTTKEEVDDRYQYFIDIKEELEENDYLKYTVKKDNLDVLVKTEIGVNTIPSFFDNYMQATNIKATSKKEDVKAYYKKENYTCEEKRNG